MNRSLGACIALALALSAVQPVTAAEPVTAQGLEARIPNIKVQSVQPVTGFDGLYEVFDSNGQVLYVDQCLTFAIVGEMFDLATRQSLT